MECVAISSMGEDLPGTLTSRVSAARAKLTVAPILLGLSSSFWVAVKDALATVGEADGGDEQAWKTLATVSSETNSTTSKLAIHGMLGKILCDAYDRLVDTRMKLYCFLKVFASPQCRGGIYRAAEEIQLMDFAIRSYAPSL